MAAIDYIRRVPGIRNLFPNGGVAERNGGEFFMIPVGGDTDATLDARAAAASFAVASVVSIRAEMVAHGRLYDGDDLFTASPNPNMGLGQFIQEFVWLMSLTGTGVVYRRGITTPNAVNVPLWNLEFPKGLDRLSDRDFTVRYEDDVRRFDIPSSDLIFAADLFPFDSPVLGWSRLRSLKYNVSIVERTLRAKHTMSDNPGGIGIFANRGTAAGGHVKPLTREEKERLERNTAAGYGTSHGKSLFHIVTSDLEYQEIAAKIKDFGYDESIAYEVGRIAQAFRIPKEVYTDWSEGTTYENQRAAMLNYIQGDVQSVGDKVAAVLSELYGRDLQMDYTHLPSMQDAKAVQQDRYLRTAETLTRMLQDGVISTEEYRDLFERWTGEAL